MSNLSLRTAGLVLLLCAAGAAPKWERLNEQAGPFVVALAYDKQGNVWVGTEDKGVFRYNPSADEVLQWSQFTTKDGLGDDNAYAIACDKRGRVWVGTLNHGVSVYNGDKWKNYDVLDGPIGERIFAIATCPTDGDVWMATSAGLTRYSVKEETWTHFTAADGLPENQANALAFDDKGSLYVGMDTHGIAIAKPADDYKKWTVQSGSLVPPLTFRGQGLPSGLINGLLVAKSGTVYAATTAGLAWSQDKGRTWAYLRGRDYGAKVKGRRGGAPSGWREAPAELLDMPDDYITCIAEDDAGLIWMGFRQHGLIALDPKTARAIASAKAKPDGLPDDYVTAILPIADSRPLAGTYGAGVGRLGKALVGGQGKRALPKKDEKKEPAEPPALPKRAKAPSAQDLADLAADLRKPVSAKPAVDNTVLVLDDDWKTQGDFYGASKYRDLRYGESMIRLCAFASPFDSEWGRDGMRFFAWARTGSHAMKGEALRHWVHWARTTNPRCLKNPFETNRCQSEWDDHKEAYSLSHDGPHIYITAKTPPGAYYLSLYFHNKDGHDGMNRLRDYVITIKPQADTDAQFAKAPVLARARVHNFWGGVYKRFLVSGKGNYTIELNANWSFNTMVSAVGYDPVTHDERYARLNDDIPRVRFSFTTEEADKLREGASTLSCLGELETLRYNDPVRFARKSRSTALLLLRGLPVPKEGEDGAARRRAACYHYTHLFDERDRLYSTPKKKASD